MIVLGLVDILPQCTVLDLGVDRVHPDMKIRNKWNADWMTWVAVASQQAEQRMSHGRENWKVIPHLWESLEGPRDRAFEREAPWGRAYCGYQ